MSALETPTATLRPVVAEPAKTMAEKADAILAWCTLIGIDLLMKWGGFQRFHRTLRSWPIRRRSNSPDVIAGTCTAVDRATTYYFKRAWCLQRSATAVFLLRRRGFDARLVIGAQKIPFYAHAWAEVDGRVVNDYPSVQKKYTVLERC